MMLRLTFSYKKFLKKFPFQCFAMAAADKLYNGFVLCIETHPLEALMHGEVMMDW